MQRIAGPKRRRGYRQVAWGATALIALAAPSFAGLASPASAATHASSVAVHTAATTEPAGVVPQSAAAALGSTWLASQVTSSGVVLQTGTTAVDPGDTLQVLLALAATGTSPSTLATGLAYVEAHVDSFVESGAVYNPGNLAQAILLAHATGTNPQSFGGVNLVAQLLGTATLSGPDAGLFGPPADATYDGAYKEGLGLVALAAAGTHFGAGVSWLQGQQCEDGGWEAFRTSTATACGAPDAVDFSGPDTNSTALAVQGLAAQGLAVGAAPLTFLSSLQASDGGWGYFGGESDTNSTSVVTQALIAAGVSPASAGFTKSGGDALNALVALQIPSGTGAGALDFQPEPGGLFPNLLATEQAVPALAGLTNGFGPPVPAAYRLVAADGGVFTFGTSFLGSHGGSHLNSPIVAAAATSDGKGYYLVAADGGVFTYGDAVFAGSEGGSHLNSPIVGMAVDPATGGYWLVAADGGVFAFDAAFLGSRGGSHLNSPIVGAAATADGKGYYLVAADGGVFTYGDAVFAGSEGGSHLNSPIVGAAVDPATGGYWLVAADGGVFAFDAPFLGSHGGAHLNSPIVSMGATPDGLGYLLTAADGGVFTYGDAHYAGSEGATHLNSPVVGSSVAPTS